ncbi:hypothetical protein ABTE26_21435, partial [Acinetobacter baumannii]
SHNAVVTISIPAIKKAGVGFTNTMALHANTTIPLSIDLTNARVDLTKNGTTQNKIEIFYTTTITKANNNSSGSITY